MSKTTEVSGTLRIAARRGADPGGEFVPYRGADEYERERYVFVNVDKRLYDEYKRAFEKYHAAMNSLEVAHRDALERWMRENPGKFTIGGGITSTA